ncbi:MAG: peptide deformylase [Ilumatobacteraceae bacterium]
MSVSGRKGTNKKSFGRVTVGPCDTLGGDRHCEPLNRVWIVERPSRVRQSYAACTCGRRFALRASELPIEAVERVTTPLPDDALNADELRKVIEGLWPEDVESELAKVGVVPVGTEVLHHGTRSVARDSESAIDTLQARLLRTMAAANGIGLAANQIGAPVKMLAHNLPRVAPAVLVNPVVLSSSGQWEYEEGCLSLQLDGVRASLRRPKTITIVGDLPDGRGIVILADELLARVLQHELDHLDGIEYVQRLVGMQRDRVYATIRSAGIDVRWLPPQPYASEQ